MIRTTYMDGTERAVHHYTYQEKVNILRVLIGAKAHLWTGTFAGDTAVNGEAVCVTICSAIAEAEKENLLDDFHADATLQLLYNRMGGIHNLGAWLSHHHPALARSFSLQQRQAYRHAWLDALIVEFSQ